MSITNPERDDGFGAQYQNIIFCILYCELTNNQFIYRPFKKIDHNYENDFNFEKKLDDFINIKNEYNILKEKDVAITLDNQNLYTFVENNLERAIETESFKKIKNLLFKNKSIQKNKNELTISIHYRKPLNCDIGTYGYTDEFYYLKILDFINKNYPESKKIHLYSTGNIIDFDHFFQKNIILHINEPIEKTFLELVNSDILFLSKGSFSYCAGLLCDGEVFHIPFWHKSLKKWKTI